MERQRPGDLVTDPEGSLSLAASQTGSTPPLTRDRRATRPHRNIARYADAMLRELPMTQSPSDDGQPLLLITENSKSRKYLELAEDMPEAG